MDSIINLFNGLSLSYQQFITNHENYTFVLDKKTWVSISNESRKSNWNKKKIELIQSGKIPKESTLVHVARYIHPTKKHTCKLCNNECSIFYEYPSANTWKWITLNFKLEKNDQTIFEIYSNFKNTELFEKYFGMSMDSLEKICKSDQYSGKKLSPGVMSNAPDRLDGFHCYNSICGCRSKHDKGRSYENMKNYTRDRRAYEYFSDGRCLLANRLMGKLNTIVSRCFICTKENQSMTADHIGPISLGFIHDPINFQACCQSCNSSKNNRLTKDDITLLKSKESITSWWATDAWENCKNMDVNVIQSTLDKNTKKFLCILLWLKNNRLSVLESFCSWDYMDFVINNVAVIPMTGTITFNHIEKGSKQSTRTKEVLLEINEKTNRKINVQLSEHEIDMLSDINVDNFKNKVCKVLSK